MNRDDIIRMAREAGFAGTASEFYMKALERFATLVAEHEREAEYVEIAKARIASAHAQPKQENLF